MQNNVIKIFGEVSLRRSGKISQALNVSLLEPIVVIQRFSIAFYAREALIVIRTLQK